MSEIPTSQLYETDASDAIRRLNSLGKNQVKAEDRAWAEDVIRGRRETGVRVHPLLVMAVAVIAKETRMPEREVSRHNWLDGVYRHQFNRTLPGMYGV